MVFRELTWSCWTPSLLHQGGARHLPLSPVQSGSGDCFVDRDSRGSCNSKVHSQEEEHSDRPPVLPRPGPSSLGVQCGFARSTLTLLSTCLLQELTPSYISMCHWFQIPLSGNRTHSNIHGMRSAPTPFPL